MLLLKCFRRQDEVCNCVSDGLYGLCGEDVEARRLFDGEARLARFALPHYTLSESFVPAHQ